jgi:hypothetical protein
VSELEQLVRQFQRVKLAPGIAGKSAYVAVAVVIGLSVLAFRIDVTNTTVVLVLIAAMFMVLVITIIGMMWFAARHPGPSLLEGAELIAYQQTEQAAKGIGPLPEQGAVVNPRRQLTDGDVAEEER